MDWHPNPALRLVSSRRRYDLGLFAGLLHSGLLASDLGPKFELMHRVAKIGRAAAAAPPKPDSFAAISTDQNVPFRHNRTISRSVD
jgi:hypothetical protein